MKSYVWPFLEGTDFAEEDTTCNQVNCGRKRNDRIEG